MMPSFVLKRTVLQGFDTGKYETDIADSIDFMVERVSNNIIGTLHSNSHRFYG